MDIIYRALERGFHITDNMKLKNQTWEEFEEAVQTKKVWIFGIGKATGFFWKKYNGSIPIEGVLDNDKRKQGKCLGDYVGITQGTPEGEILIKGIESLLEMKAGEIVVLVSSVRYYEEISAELERAGIDNVYALIVMEANAHKDDLQKDMGSGGRGISEEESYVTECMEYPIEEKKILIYIGRYGGHGRAISKRLIEKDPALDIVWIVEQKSSEVPPDVRCILISCWKEYIRELTTAHIWIYDDLIPLYAHKRMEQIYIQTKHWASITLKNFGWDRKDRIRLPAARDWYTHNSRAIDYIFVGSRFDEESCRSGFDFAGECIYVGSPRSDLLFESGLKEKVCSFYGVSADRHILLYAPTFRDVKNKGKRTDDLDFCRLEKALCKKFGGKWTIFLRLHPSIAIESTKIYKPEFVIDTSYYPESQELVAASDIMITDYSSIMFESAFIGRAVFLYAPDKEEYIRYDRNLLLDYDSLPFPICGDNKELSDTIMEFDEEDYKRKLKEFLELHDVHEDGHASERAAEFILKLLGEENA